MATNTDTSLDALAASYLAADVATAKAELAELVKSIDKLQAQKRALEYKINRLSVVPPQDTRTSDWLSTVPPPPGSLRVVAEPAIGFREKIREILRESPGKGLKPRVVAERLVSSGLKYNGTTDIKTRVNNDLHRLLKSGSVKRRAGLYYINNVEPVRDEHAP